MKNRLFTFQIPRSDIKFSNDPISLNSAMVVDANTNPDRLCIGLNLLHALPSIGGGWNYIANLLSALASFDQLNTYIAYATSESAVLVPDQPNFHKKILPVNSHSRIRRVAYENLILQALSAGDHIDCMHWFSGTQALINTSKTLVTIYDLQAYFSYANYTCVKKLYLSLFVRNAVRHATILLPMSKATANDMIQHWHVKRERMVIVPTVLESMFSPASSKAVQDFRVKYQLPENFWLYVAHLYTHKNHTRLLKAYWKVKQDNANSWKLVLRGDPMGAEVEINRIIDELDLKNCVIWLPRLDRAELPALYSSASALIYPSLYEGAGIPVLEAMSSGCPIVASDIPPIREAAGDAAMYFDPMNVSEIACAMKAFEEDHHLRATNQSRGIVRASAYKPRQAIESLLNAYQLASGRIQINIPHFD